MGANEWAGILKHRDIDTSTNRCNLTIHVSVYIYEINHQLIND
jgi:hypothetical protein